MDNNLDIITKNNIKMIEISEKFSNPSCDTVRLRASGANLINILRS